MFCGDDTHTVVLSCFFFFSFFLSEGTVDSARDFLEKSNFFFSLFFSVHPRTGASSFFPDRRVNGNRQTERYRWVFRDKEHENARNNGNWVNLPPRIAPTFSSCSPATGIQNLTRYFGPITGSIFFSENFIFSSHKNE